MHMQLDIYKVNNFVHVITRQHTTYEYQYMYCTPRRHRVLSPAGVTLADRVNYVNYHVNYRLTDVPTPHH